MNLLLKYKWLLFCVVLVSSQTVSAQSSTVDNGYRSTAPTDTTFEFSQYLYIGPNAVWEIHGTHIIYSTNIWIAPTAQISGTGTLIIMDPSANPFYSIAAQPTNIDGNNGNFIDLNIELHNPQNLILVDIDDPGYGISNPSGSLEAALKIGKDFSFEVENADVFLNGNDFVFDADATISNYGDLNMVVTGNSIAGHMVKENTSSTTFTFPVGIAEGDYTPAIITGESTYHVSVQDYGASASAEIVVEEGMNRTWHVYGGPATYIELHHNSPDTDGSLFQDGLAFITRYTGSALWTTGTPEQIATGRHANGGDIPSGIPVSGTVDQAYLTKSSEPTSPLPVTWMYFDVQKTGDNVQLEWATASEKINEGFEVQRSINGVEWISIGFVNSKSENGNSNHSLYYDFVDASPENGINYYRLKQIDYDGLFEYSVVKNVIFDENSEWQVYPNPTTRFVQIKGLQIGEQVMLFSVDGQLIESKRVRHDLEQISLDHLSSGTYILMIQNEQQVRSSHKIIKQ